MLSRPRADNSATRKYHWAILTDESRHLVRRALPTGARWPRIGIGGIDPELRSAAAAHHSRHGRHRRSQQELGLLCGDAPSPRAGAAGRHVPRLRPASPGTIFARVETTPMGTEVRFIITNPRRARQGALRKVFWPVREPNRKHRAPGPGPRLLAVAGKPASRT